MNKQVLVLGCGMVGATLAKDLAAEPTFDVTVADVNDTAFARLENTSKIRTVRADLSRPDRVKELVQEADLVAGALPSAYGYQTIRAVLECGKPYCDISFMVEDPTDLDDLARDQGVTAVFDCGVAPGLANMIIGHCDAQLDETHSAVYYVGGLPKVRTWPYQYKAPFAPSDVLEEYTRPARMIEGGREIVRPALSEPELIDFPRIGTLEGFNTDGLRSLVKTVKARNMKEKTLRWPGHCELMRALRETGFLDKSPIEVDGVRIRPIDLAERLIFPKWRLDADEEEFTILRVIVDGMRVGRRRKQTYELYDERDPATGDHSMARTTAFPCAIMLRLIAGGEFTTPGVFPPESVGATSGMLDRMISELAARGVHIGHECEECEAPQVREV